MAGEIQLNSTTMATESSGTITLSNVNSATNRTNLGLGSMATQNANAVALTGGSLTGTEIDLKSSGTSIYKSDGTTAVLSESGGVVTLTNTIIKNIPVFKAQLSTNQFTTSGVETKLILSDEVFDSHNFFDATTNYRFQPTIAGYYKFDATVFINGSPSAFYLIFYKSESPFNQGATDFAGYYSNGIIGSTIIELNGSTDYVELYASQTSANGFYNSSTFKSYLTGYLISGT